MTTYNPKQESIHEALALRLPDEGEVLTGWIVVYEVQAVDEDPSAGHVYGPEGMTTWRAMGLLEWAKQRTLGPDDEDAA